MDTINFFSNLKVRVGFKVLVNLYVFVLFVLMNSMFILPQTFQFQGKNSLGGVIVGILSPKLTAQVHNFINYVLLYRRY